MVKSVRKSKNGGFIINEAVEIHNIDYTVDADGLGGVIGDIKFDSTILCESEAIELAEYFLNKAIKAGLKKEVQV